VVISGDELYFQCARSKTTGFIRLAFSIFLFFQVLNLKPALAGTGFQP